MRLHKVVEAYIEFKRALGARLESEARLLRAFCRSVGDIDVEDVKPAVVLAFLAGAGPVTRTWKQKASVLRSFYRYAVGRGHATNAPLPTTMPKFPPMRIPHIIRPMNSSGCWRRPRSWIRPKRPCGHWLIAPCCCFFTEQECGSMKPSRSL